MDGFDRIYDLHRILKGRRTAISTQKILEEMECSRATFNRIKRHMKDFLGAPIEYNKEQGGHYYAEDQQGNFELPGIWFNAKELQALLLVQQLLNDVGVGMLEKDLSPITKRIEQLLKKNGLTLKVSDRKIRFLGVAIRNVPPKIFLRIVESTLRAQAVKMTYTAREDGQRSTRSISPQRIINYRNNWYLDAWCHKRKYYRTFAIECISNISDTTDAYKKIPSNELDQYFQASYGIFAGDQIEMAVVRFSKQVSQRIACEEWHPEQKGYFLDDGRYQLELPINIHQPHEFLRDILAFSNNAKIIQPDILKVKLQELLMTTLKQYDENTPE